MSQNISLSSDGQRFLCFYQLCHEGKHQSDSQGQWGEWPHLQASDLPGDCSNLRLGLCCHLLCKGDDAGYGRQDLSGWGKLYPLGWGVFLFLICGFWEGPAPLRKNGLFGLWGRGRGGGEWWWWWCMTEFRSRGHLFSTSMLPNPAYPLATSVCTSVSPLKLQVNNCKQKSCALCFKKQK